MDGTAVVVDAGGSGGALVNAVVVVGAFGDALGICGALVNAVGAVGDGAGGKAEFKSSKSIGGVNDDELDCVVLGLLGLFSSRTAGRKNVVVLVDDVAFILARIASMPCITLAVLRWVCSRRWLIDTTLACRSPIARTRVVRSSMRVIKCACWVLRRVPVVVIESGTER